MLGNERKSLAIYGVVKLVMAAGSRKDYLCLLLDCLVKHDISCYITRVKGDNKIGLTLAFIKGNITAKEFKTDKSYIRCHFVAIFDNVCL